MKRTKLFFLLMFFLVSCSSKFPKVASYYTSPFELTDEEKFWHEDLHLRLSPDGSSIVVGGRYLVNLATGEREDLYKRVKVGRDTTMKNDDILDGDITYWSFDGRYLGMLANHYESSREPVGYATYIFDLRDNTFRRYNTWSGAFSPFSSNQILTREGVYSLNDGTIIPLVPDYDFSRDKNFGGTIGGTGVLWSQKLGVPVAQLSISSPSKNESNVVLESLNINDPTRPKYSIPIGFSYQSPDWAIYRLLDPTGEYALIIQWKCAKDLAPCATVPVNPDSVYDSVLTLVRWRTKEQKELIRLSEIDPEHVVAYGYMAWSADGSTIFVARRDAPAIVLKVKYP